MEIIINDDARKTHFFHRNDAFCTNVWSGVKWYKNPQNSEEKPCDFRVITWFLLFIYFCSSYTLLICTIVLVTKKTIKPLIFKKIKGFIHHDYLSLEIEWN